MFTAIDWTRPWCASVSEAAAVIGDSDEWIIHANQLCTAQALTNHRGLALRFVDHAALPKSHAYEAFISQTGQIPTRQNLHDYFNALVWLSFPCIKQQLNAVQAAQIESRGIGESRGRARDAATIFDENCALLVVSDTQQGNALADALRGHQWQQALVEQREWFGKHAEVWLFGHALLEKLVRPYKSITAHAWPVVMPAAFFALPHADRRAQLDKKVGLELQQGALSITRFTPLPVLGVPGWWPSQDAEFYADATVFRPPRVLIAD